MPDSDPSVTALAQIRQREEWASSRYAEVPELRESLADIPLLLAAIEALTAALERHQQWFINDAGVKICGGCLEPVPCPDTDVIGRALAGKDSSDE